MSGVRGRSGKVRVGLLVGLIVLAATGYYGFVFGRVYWQKYKLQEMLQQDFGFVGQLTDESIRQKVLDDVASMHLPSKSLKVQWLQTEQPRGIGVRISYVVTVNLLFAKKPLPVTVDVRRAY